jgi:hypothetical protein
VGKFILMPDGTQLPVQGQVTICALIKGIPKCMTQCYHVPDLQVCLYLLCRHRRTAGCSFVGDHNGMFLTFKQK